ncbi:MAG: SPOR domain-containing protein [Gammaproteobacteria bacterium]
MNQGTKQRIVGTIVLLALALIFLPLLFDGEGSYQPEIASRIPAPPELQVMPVPVQSRPVIVADTPQIILEQQGATEPAQEAVTNLGTEVAAVEESRPDFVREIPALSPEGLPQAWVVRLGSFAEAGNAVSLVQRLQAAGYKAYTRELGSGQGTLTAVYVGPWLERSRVDEYRQQLQDEFQLSGMVVRYELEQL